MSGSLKPVRQGAIDGLCGVYAVLNACRLLAVTGDERIPKDVQLDQTRRLFRALCMEDETRALFPRIVCEGVYALDPLLRVAQRWATRHSMVDLTIEQPHLPADMARHFFTALQGAMAHHRGERKAYILGLAPPCDHWTVVRRIRDDKLLVFDSCAFPTPRRKWARFAEFTFDRKANGVATGKRHVIDASSSYLLTSRYR